MTTRTEGIDQLEYRKVTAEEQQQEFCNYLGFQQSSNIWDEYDPDIHPDIKNLLLRKINLIFGDELDETINVSPANSVPSTPCSENVSNCDETTAKKISKIDKFKKMKENLVDTIWSQRKYNKDILLMSPIFVALVSDYKLYKNNLTWCKYSLEYSLHPVFRIIKCRKNGESHGCCMIFVDEHARVYQNWDQFKRNNQYAPGFIVAPKLGVYNTNETNRVLLDVFPSDCLRVPSKLAATADTVTTVGGFAATGITIASIASIPVLPVVATGALVAGLGCAAYSIGRSTFKLFDRSKHEQTIKITDNEARSHWFGVAAGTIGLGAGAATKGLATAASRGSSISKVVTGSVNALNGAAIFLNGVGTVNGVYSIFLKKLDGEDISMLEMAQLGSSLFIFTHSVYNFQTANNIVRSSQSATIGEYRRGLSRNQQRAFDKLVKETIRQKGVDVGHLDVIRSLRNIKDAKQFFGNAYKANKELNRNNVKISLHPDGEILLNDAKQISAIELKNSLQQSSAENVFANLPTIPETHPAAGKISLNSTNFLSTSVVSTDHVLKVVNGLIQLGILIVSGEDLASVLIDFGERVTLYVFDSFVDFIKSYYAENYHRLCNSLNVTIPFEGVLIVALDIITKMSEYCGLDIRTYMEQMDWNFLRLEINQFYNRLRDRITQRGQPFNHCKICLGYYY